MDARVNDFLNEINEIAPLGESKSENVWEKCFDEESGYHYYWNTKTDQVTWEMPSDYKAHKSKVKRSSNLYIPPRTAPLFPSTSKLPPVADNAIKIYKIGENATVDKKQEEKKVTKETESKDDEKVVLISYSGDSESEEESVLKEKAVNGSKPEVFEPKSLPSKEVSVESEKPALSLVAGYSDSEEEPEVPQVAHSTLFPISKPIDIKDFEKSPEASDEQQQGFDSKVFQRKKRIGVALINTGKKTKLEGENERKGLGFSGESNLENGSTYPGFKSGGVMFVKADVLNPPAKPKEEENSESSVEIDETYKNLKEKLGFLGEGKDVVSPVQVMLIQLETLHSALKSGGLKQSYLKKWLEETSSDLIKLEKEATPEGWLLQWDRTHKRYYYQNASTGDSQWEYPEADVTVCDEAMDICTTPPPNGAESTIHMSPPLPPTIASPSPPPPPSITDCKKRKCDIPLPPTEEFPSVNAAVERYDKNGEPLPPGVDSLDSNKNKDLNDVLSSFYSDIAAIETSATASSENGEVKSDPAAENTEAKKKKKSKVKLAQGIAMKKKGVSKLVEKWKSVQMSYND